MKLSVISECIRASSEDFRGMGIDRTFNLWRKGGGDAKFSSAPFPGLFRRLGRTCKWGYLGPGEGKEGGLLGDLVVVHVDRYVIYDVDRGFQFQHYTQKQLMLPTHVTLCWKPICCSVLQEKTGWGTISWEEEPTEPSLPKPQGVRGEISKASS